MKRALFLTILSALAAGFALTPAAVATELPFRQLVREPNTQFPPFNAITPAYLATDSAANVAVDQGKDLALTDWAVKPGPAVLKVLAEVGSDPLAAYRWVRDNVEYMPYFGVKAGAEGVAWERSGNDFDQAALLASLLRSQGVPVRFVYGVVRVDAKTAADWCGTASADDAYKLIVQGGLPANPLMAGQIIKAIDVDHVWLEARVPYTSPGRQGPGEGIWVPLDPSFKRHAATPGLDLFPQLGFKMDDFLLDYLSTADDKSPEGYFRDLLNGQLESLGNLVPLSEATFRISVIPEGPGSLPTALPPAIQVQGIVWEKAEILRDYNYRIKLTLWDGKDDGQGVMAGDVDVTIPTAFLSQHALTVLYRPATAEDEALAASTATGSPLDPSIRQQIKMRPHLLADGKPIGDFFTGDRLEAGIPYETVAEGRIGLRQGLRVETLQPMTGSDSYVAQMALAEKDLSVGGAYALGLTGAVPSADMIVQKAAELRTAQEGGNIQEILAATLSLSALEYLHRTGTSNLTLGAFLGVRSFQEPSLMVCGIKPNPTGYDTQGVFFDVMQYVMSFVSRDGMANRERAYLFLAGLESSYYEHQVLSELFRTTAVSAVRILKQVQASPQPPLVLRGTDQDLESTLAGIPGLSSEERTDILDKMIRQGYMLAVPRTLTTLELWSGTGYILWDPSTGAGGYMISGGLAGGNLSGSVPRFTVELLSYPNGGHGYGENFHAVVWSFIDPVTQELVGYVSFASDNKPFIAWVGILPADSPLPEAVTLGASSSVNSLPDFFPAGSVTDFMVLGYCWFPDNPHKDKLTPIVLHRSLDGTLNRPENANQGIPISTIQWYVADESAGLNDNFSYDSSNTTSNVKITVDVLETEPIDGLHESSIHLFPPPTGFNDLITLKSVAPTIVPTGGLLDVDFSVNSENVTVMAILVPFDDSNRILYWQTFTEASNHESWDGGKLVIPTNAVEGDAEIRLVAYKDTSGGFASQTETADIVISNDELPINTINFEPWSVDVSLPEGECSAPIPSVGITYQVSVSGTLTLAIVNDHDEVVMAWAPEPQTVGFHTLTWDLYDSSRIIVQEGDYHLRATWETSNPSRIMVVEGGNVYVRIDDRGLDIGKSRGKGFYEGVDVGNGNKFLEVDDISLPFSNHDFKWTRYYNSKRRTSGPLGVGWSHRYDIRVKREDGGYFKVWWGNGSAETFDQSGNPLEHSLNDLTIKAGGGYTLTTPESNLQFDTDGYITSGWGMQFDYEGTGGEKRLTSISNSFVSASVNYLTYGNIHLISSVSATVSGVTQSVSYQNYLKKANTSQNAFQYSYYLNYVASSRLGSFSYQYDKEVATPQTIPGVGTTSSLHYLLTRSDDPFMGVTRYSYDVTTEACPPDGSGTVMFVPTIKVASITNDGGRGWEARGTATYFHSSGGSLQIHLTSSSGSWQENTVYDTADNTMTSRTDANGNRTQYFWDDAKKNLLEYTRDATSVEVHRTYQGSTDWLATERFSGNLGEKTYTYYSDGGLRTITDANSHTTTYSYAYHYNLAGIAPNGGLGTRVTITDPDSRITYRYLDCDGRTLCEVVDPNGLNLTWNMTYDKRGNMLTREDPRHHVTHYRYDAWDRVTKEWIGDEGNPIWVMNYAYDHAGNRLKAWDATGNSGTDATTFEYDAGNRLVKEYDRFGKLVRENDRNGTTGWVDFSWDLNRKLTKYAYFDNGWIRQERLNPLSAELELVQVGDLVTEYVTYDGRGNVLKKRDPRGKEWNSTYDNAGRLFSSTDPTGHVTEYEYFDDGDRKAEYGYLDGARTLRASYVTNAAGWVTEDRRPYRTNTETFRNQYSYDSRGNRTTATDDKGNAVSYVYSTTNLLEREIDPFEQVVRSLTYYTSGQNNGMLETETDYNGRTSRYEYDSSHRVSSIWDPHHIATIYDYDLLSRVISETRAGISLNYPNYDANGNRQTVEDGNAHRRYLLFDDANRLLVEYAGLDGPGETYYPIEDIQSLTGVTIPANLPATGKLLRRVEYDTLGRAFKEYDAENNLTTNAFYLNNWLKRKDFADTSWEEYQYNSIGNKISLRRNNGSNGPLETSYDYAGNGLQVSLITHPDDRTESYTYTGANDILSRTDRDGVTDWFEYKTYLPDPSLSLPIQSYHLMTKRWRQNTSALLPTDCIVEAISVDPAATKATGVVLEAKAYTAAGDVDWEENSSQYARGVKVDYAYSGAAANPMGTVSVVLEKKTDANGASRFYDYYPGTDRVQYEWVKLATPSGYTATQMRLDGTVTVPVLRLASYAYDLAGNLELVTDGDGRLRNFGYDELNRKSQEWRSLAGETKDSPMKLWTYDGRGDVKTESLYGINNAAPVSITTHVYDSRGRKIKTIFADGTFEEWGYDLAGNPARHRDPDNRIAWTKYDPLDRPFKNLTVVPIGSPYLKPEYGFRTEQTEPINNIPADGIAILVAEKQYNADSDVDWEKDARGVSTNFTYGTYHRPETKTTLYTAFPVPSSAGVPNTSARWTYGYDALGKPAVVTDPNTRVSVTEYDGEGRERRKLQVLDGETGYTIPQGLSGTIYGQTGFVFAQTSYDAMGHRTSEKDGRGIESKALFDELDRVKEQSRWDTVRADFVRTASFGYDVGGNKLWWRDAEWEQGQQNTRDYHFDLRGYPDAETGYADRGSAASAVAVRTALADRQGNVLWEKDAGSPLQNEVRYTYDLRSRQTERRVVANGGRELKTSYGNDGLGNKTAETTPLGHTTTWVYDEFNKVSTATGPDTGVTRYVYDPNGNLIRIEEAEYGPNDSDASGGHFSAFEYDELNNRITASRYRTNATAVVEQAGFDGAGLQTWKQDGEGRTVSYHCDEFGRQKSESRGMPSAPVSGIDYLVGVATICDGNGNAVQTTETLQTNGSASHDRIVGRVFDDFNRMTAEAADGRTTGWAFDKDGRRTAVHYPVPHSLCYFYDGLGNLRTTKDVESDLPFEERCPLVESCSPEEHCTTEERYANGLVHFLRHANSAVEEWGYKLGTKEADSLLVKDAAQAQIRNAGYTYDDDGNRLTENDNRGTYGVVSRSNTYDDAGHLKTVTEGAKVTTYSYDKVGNRVRETVTGTSQGTDLTADFNGAGEVTSITGTKEGVEGYSAAYTYDLAGNLASTTDSSSRSLAYDNDGQTVQVTSDGATSKYLYNAEGRRALVKEGGITREYLYDGRSLLLEYSAGSPERRHLYADRLIGVATTETYALHLDPLGSTLEVTAADGSRYTSTAYDPWGGVTTDGNASPTTLLYTGHQQDATGLIYFGARYYDPALARFLSADPYEGELTTPPSLNKYLYAYANPYRWVDLDGYAVDDPSPDNKDPLSVQTSDTQETISQQNYSFDPRRGEHSIFGPLNLLSANPGLNYLFRGVNEANNASAWMVNAASNFVADTFKAVDEAPEKAGTTWHEINFVTALVVPIPTELISGSIVQLRSALPAAAGRVLKPVLNEVGAVRLGGRGAEVGAAEASASSAAETTITRNARSGAARQSYVQRKLEGKFGEESVQAEQYLRNADGTIAKDIHFSGTGRRIDHVVIKDGEAWFSVETTSKFADKDAQLAKEARIRAAGGTFVRDRTTGELVDLKDVPTRVSRRR
jgi:RHS repeat-associated protein